MSQTGGSETASRKQPVARRRFFEIYKPGQGYYTRMGTSVGSGILILGGANFVLNSMEGVLTGDAPWMLWVQYAVPTAFLVATGLLLFWLVGVHRGSCDFLIATEGEMKKVSWSSRSELIGSTKVVIGMTILMACLLASADFVFIWFFKLIGVLETGGPG